MAAAQRARTEALTDLFRTYASMSQFRLAEEVIRRNLVSDFVVRTIHREALLAPQSPMMPVTPFAGFGSLGSMLAVTPTLASPSSGAGGGSFPFSFAQQQQQQSAKSSTGSTAGSAEDKSAIPPFYQIDLVHASPSAAATDTFISDALVDMYNKLLIFISKELGVVLEITERKPAQGTGHAGPAAREPTMSSSTILGQDGDATVPGSPATRERLLSDRNGSKPGYEILSNVVWAEIAQRLMGECGHLIFSAGRPETFHRVGHNCTTVRKGGLRLTKPVLNECTELHRYASLHWPTGKPMSEPEVSADTPQQPAVHCFHEALAAARLLPAPLQGDCRGSRVCSSHHYQ